MFQPGKNHIYAKSVLGSQKVIVCYERELAKYVARHLWDIRGPSSARSAARRGKDSRKKYTISANRRDCWGALTSTKRVENRILCGQVVSDIAQSVRKNK